MGIIFKNFNLKNWLATAGILVLSVLQVGSMMLIVDNVAMLTISIQVKEEAAVWEYGLTIVGLAVGLFIIQAAIETLSSWVAADAVTRVRGKLYEKMNEFAIEDIQEFSTESMITRTTNDLQNIHLALITALRVAFMVPILIIWSVTKIMDVNPALTTSAVIWIILLILVVSVIIYIIMPRMKKLQKLTDALNLVSRENLTGLQVVRAFNAESYQENKFDAVNEKYTKLQIAVSKAVAFLTPFIMFVLNGLTLTIVWVSAYVVKALTGQAALLAFSTTNSFVMLASQIVMAFILLVILVVLWPRGVVCAKRIEEVINHSVSIKDTDNPVPFKEKGTLEFKNVSFKYPGTEGNAIEDFSFKVNRGETLAFIGSTGSGKTTAVNLIPRMFDTTEGEVLVDGVNVKDVLQKNLREIIGYVPQKKFLFKGTVRENISLSNPDMPLEDVVEAAKVAEADGFIMNSEKGLGYDNPVAQGGTNYSGGQRQRLCIARAIARKAEILIFDDSFSALDYKTDKMVRDNIKRFDENATKIIVAARIGTIMDADQILVLDKGRIVGRGKHQELLRSCKEYQEIALTQLSKEELGL